MKKESELYEIGYLLRENLKEEDVLSFLEKLRNAIVDKGGLITSEGENKKQTLAYSIKNEKTALFNWIKFSTKPESIKEIKEYLNKQTSLLRFIIIKTAKEEPLVIRKIKPPKIQTKKPLGLLTPKTLEEKKIDTETTKIKEEEIDKKIEELLREN